jgi:hypothetical protein
VIGRLCRPKGRLSNFSPPTFCVCLSFVFFSPLLDCVCAGTAPRLLAQCVGPFSATGLRVSTRAATHTKLRAAPFPRAVPPLVAFTARYYRRRRRRTNFQSRPYTHCATHLCVCRVGKRKPRVFLFQKKEKRIYFLKACAPRSHILTRAPSRTHTHTKVERLDHQSASNFLPIFLNFPNSYPIWVLATSRLGPFRRDGRPVLTILQGQVF